MNSGTGERLSARPHAASMNAPLAISAVWTKIRPIRCPYPEPVKFACRIFWEEPISTFPDHALKATMLKDGARGGGDDEDEVHGCGGDSGVVGGAGICSRQKGPRRAAEAAGRRDQEDRREGLQERARKNPGAHGKVRSMGRGAACGASQEAQIERRSRAKRSVHCWENVRSI